MNLEGLVIAVVTFVIIGVFHPIVIKCEYYFSERVWPLFLVFGLLFVALSLFISSSMLSAILGVLGCTCLWSILELKHQTKRVEKGWFPKNPNRRKRS